MTWAISPELCRPGDLLTRADVCHLHESRDEAERCGAEHDGCPELVRLERQSERVYRVVWSLSDTASGKLRRVAPTPGPFNAPRLTEGVSEDLTSGRS